MMHNYEDLCFTREDNVAGIGPWRWLKQDNGAWDGPKKDFEESHIHAYKKHIENWTVVVQAGGCQGMYPRIFSEIFQRVYTFEPDPLSFFVLNINCQKDNIIKMQAALGAENKLISVVRNVHDNVGMNTVTEEHQVIPMLTVDSLNLNACDFIQFDLEGYELYALMGAVNTIRQFKPVISCERGNDLILDFLKQFGYSVVDHSIADTIYKVVPNE